MGNENASIVEYLEGTNGIRYYLEDFQKEDRGPLDRARLIV